MRFEAIMDARDDSPLYQYVADTMASLLPKALEYEVPGAGKLDITSVGERMRSEMNAVGYAMLVAPMVCAWCSTPA
jgi:hypothetical protein